MQNDVAFVDVILLYSPRYGPERVIHTANHQNADFLLLYEPILQLTSQRTLDPNTEHVQRELDNAYIVVVRLPARVRCIYPPRSVQNGSGTHTAAYPVGTVVSSLGKKRLGC